MSSAAFPRFEPGDPFPWFRQRNTSNPAFVFDRVGGRYSFEPRFRGALIAHYNAAAGAVSGFMRDVQGRTRLTQDRGFKVQQDHVVD